MTPETPKSAVLLARKAVKPRLVYWHLGCDTWWDIEMGLVCPMEHDTPIYDDRPRCGRKRRAWICEEGEGGIAYLSRKDFLEHAEGECCL